ncbi:MAG: ADP-ribosylglycohydrolase family protein [Acidobacteria bacterium]|nr:ADP-ribosylglycohydrolase family protein [Acidobacteriota bacterium]
MIEAENNSDILDRLFAEKRIAIRRGRLFDNIPAPVASPFLADRIEGMMLGLAIGDSLGNTSESLVPRERFRRFGEIRDYLPNRHAYGRRIGLPSDDTQLAFRTLDEFLENGRFDPEKTAARFCRERIYGIGSSVSEFRRRFNEGKLWYECGPESAGNGALMRIAPILIPHVVGPSPKLWVDTGLCALITHNDSASIASCLAFVDILWKLLGMTEAPPAGWWLETFLETIRDLETKNDYQTRGGDFPNFRGTLARFLETVLGGARERYTSTLEACNSWYSGAYLLETVPSALYILMNYAADPEEAIVRAVNDTRDNDTVAAIVGAAVGALHGKKSLPQRWRAELSGKISADDDGKVFEILEGVSKFLSAA